jgi:5-methylcytosine-specific restriction endonuclease McrA
MAKVRVSCLHCGEILLRYPSHIRGSVFCDRGCRKDYHRPLLVCSGCGDQFLRDPKQPDRQYCTWECFKASRHMEIMCTVCGSVFDSYLSEQRKRVDRGHVPCCSTSCRNTYTSLLLGGDGSWVPGGRYKPSRDRGYAWRKTRARYISLVGSVCEGCSGASVEQVHHLHPVAAGGDMYDFDNLMAVCRDCHGNMHEQLREGAFWCSFEEAHV